MTATRKKLWALLEREPVHPFPARMAPEIAFGVVSDSPQPLRVLDPMAGSGTVLAVARSRGHRAYGIDIDPLAVKIAQVWTTTICRKTVREAAEQVLARARARFARTFVSFPAHCDAETRQFISYWFDVYSRRQLNMLAESIGEVPDGAVRNALWCGFSRLIIAKQAGASLAMDLAHSRPHKVFDKAPLKPFGKFIAAVDKVANNCVAQGASQRGPATWVREGDARKLPLGDSCIDLVLTSPPYLNAIDYFRCSKFSLVWMGYQIWKLRELRSISVGTESSDKASLDESFIHEIAKELRLRPMLPPRELCVLKRYIHDMRAALREVSRVLRPEGRAVYVVGENTIKGTYVRNSQIIVAAAELCGLSLTDRRSRKLPENRRYLPPPLRKGNAAMDARMRREVLLEFVKR